MPAISQVRRDKARSGFDAGSEETKGNLAKGPGRVAGTIDSTIPQANSYYEIKKKALFPGIWRPRKASGRDQRGAAARVGGRRQQWRGKEKWPLSGPFPVSVF
jgi:hypothetical protein